MALTRKKSKKQTVTFPRSVFETADTKEDLEDWLRSQNPGRTWGRILNIKPGWLEVRLEEKTKRNPTFFEYH